MTMADYGGAFRQCLLDIDTNTMRKLWRYVAPNMPQPESDRDITISIHHARTLAKSLPFEPRAYSHSWLMERQLPSGLPDHLKPRAERLYPWIVSAVGISINYSNPDLKPVGEAVRKAMEAVVLEAHADGRMEDKAFLWPRMMEARRRVLKELIIPNRIREL